MRKVQLFLMHFAGGNSYSYQFMAPMLSNFELVPLELPGRGKRMAEPILHDFFAAADDMYRQVNEKLYGNKYLIYGHSMGAFLGMRVASMMEKAGKPPAYLFVSGNSGPGLIREEKDHLLPDKEFMDMLIKMGGLSPELLENQELLDFFLPIIRSDFEVTGHIDPPAEDPISAPIYAMMGSEEDEVEKIDNWKRFSSTLCETEVMPGDHFFIHKHAQKIAKVINDKYHALVTAQYMAK
jgi:external thioesterase TEII